MGWVSRAFRFHHSNVRDGRLPVWAGVVSDMVGALHGGSYRGFAGGKARLGT